MNLITPPGGPAPTTEMKINPTQLDDVTCDECGNFTFVKVVLMKRMPALISPTAQEAFMPMEVFCCNSCGHINTRFIKGMGGWFKGAEEDVDATEVPEAGERDSGTIVGSDLPDMDAVSVDDEE